MNNPDLIDNWWQAVAKGEHTTCVQLLKQHPELISIKTPEGMMAIHIASTFNHINLFNVLLQQILSQQLPLSLFVTETGDTPFHSAARMGCDAIIKYIEAIAQPEKTRVIEAWLLASNRVGDTPLHIVSRETSFEKRTHFIAGVKLKQAAKRKKHLNKQYHRIYKYILQKLSDSYYHDSDAEQTLNVDQLSHYLNAQNNQNNTVLHELAQSGRGRDVSKLLCCFPGLVSVNLTNRAGNTPLHIAAIHSHPYTLQQLLGSRDLNAILENHEKKTALQIAIHDSNLTDDDFGKLLDRTKRINEEDIKTRLAVMKKKFFRTMIIPVIGSLCPASFLALEIGSMLSIFAFPFIPVALFFISYTALVVASLLITYRNFNNLAAQELMYKRATFGLKKHIADLKEQTEQFAQRLRNTPACDLSKSDLVDQWKKIRQSVQNPHYEILTFVKAEEFKKLRNLSHIVEPKDLAGWGSPKDSVLAFIQSGSGILCAAGAMAELAVAAVTYFIAASMLGTPITALVIFLAVAVSAAIIGYVIYKKEKQELAERNRRVVAAYDEYMQQHEKLIADEQRLSYISHHKNMDLESFRNYLTRQVDAQAPKPAVLKVNRSTQTSDDQPNFTDAINPVRSDPSISSSQTLARSVDNMHVSTEKPVSNPITAKMAHYSKAGLLFTTVPTQKNVQVEDQGKPCKSLPMKLPYYST